MVGHDLHAEPRLTLGHSGEFHQVDDQALLRQPAGHQAGERPGQAVFDDIVRAQVEAQPFVYPSGLIELPMNPISDIGAFRGGRWPLEDFLKAIRLGVAWAIEHKAVYDFLAHPSCLLATDPQFQSLELICDLVHAAGDKAEIVDLGKIAGQI